MFVICNCSNNCISWQGGVLRLSFKLRRDWGSVACSMKDGVITVEDGLIPDIQVDTCLNGLTFEKQHINFNNGNIQCILKNEKYTFVLRWDGSYTVYLAHNNCICASRGRQKEPAYEFDIASYKLVTNGGIIDTPVKEIITACWLIRFNNRIFLFCDNNAIVGCDVDENSYYYRYCKTNANPVKPDLKFGNDRLLYMASAANTPVVVKKFYNFDNATFVKPNGGD